MKSEDSYHQMIQRWGWCEVRRSLIKVSGGDRVAWLQGLVTNDLKNRSVREAPFAVFCGRDGRMLATAVLHFAEDHLLIETESELRESLLRHLDHYLIREDVVLEVSDDNALFEIHGPDSFSLLDLPTLGWFEQTAVERWGGIASGNRVLGLSGLTLILPNKCIELFRQYCMKRGDGAQIDAERYDSLRIENGFPRWGIDMTPQELPMEAGLTPIAISYSKGCYLGQEVIQRVKTYSEPPKMLLKLEMEGTHTPSRGARIWIGDLEVGEITSVSYSPADGHPIALGYLKKGYQSEGGRVNVIDQGFQLEARVSSLPWLALLEEKRNE